MTNKRRNFLPFLSQFCGQQLSPEFCTSLFPQRSTNSTQTKSGLLGKIMIWGSELFYKMVTFSTFTPPLNRVRKVNFLPWTWTRLHEGAREWECTHLAWVCTIAQRGQRTPFSVACTLSFSIRSPAFPTHSCVNLLESNVGSIEQRALSARSGAKGQRSQGIHGKAGLHFKKGKLLLRV